MGVSVHGGLCPGDLCPGVLCPAGVSVQGVSAGRFPQTDTPSLYSRQVGITHPIGMLSIILK